MPQIYACLDFGNTDIKVSVFEQGQLSIVKRFSSEQALFADLSCEIPVGVSSVRNHSIELELKNYFKNLTFINSNSKLPFQNAYSSPETLGIDRLCNAAALSSKKKVGAKLAVDFGTCIKFDFLNSKNEYLGGSISPGLKMRFKALNQQTANLPLIDPIENPKIIGQTTSESIQSGVQNGIIAEVFGMIDQYEEQFPDLTVYFTGGDLQNFDFPQKNNIFVDENLTLIGISEIYKLNAHTV
ncbi:MAG: type III pantothenate kinase [Bacteroidota bacterium]